MALWERARQLTAAMGGALNSRYDYDDMGFVGGNPEPLFQERMPYVALNFYAEGTHAELELATQAWSQAASRTPETWDDAFIQLLVESYGNAEGRGWAAWQAREWDYGGCSPLGSGLHKDLLLQTDALAGRAVIAEPVGRIRGAVLGDIEQRRGPGEFPYCGGPNLDATPVEALQAEALQILAEVTLSDAERSMIEARVTAGFAGD
jgi:hypothetical protein